MSLKDWRIGTNIPMAAELTMKLLYVKKADREDDWHSLLHEHPYAEIFYVTRGRGRMQLQKGHLDLEAGDLLFVNAHLRHTEERIDDEPFSYIVIGVEGISMMREKDEDDDEPVNLYDDWRQRGVILQRSVWQQSRIGSLIETLQSEFEERQPYYQAYCHKLLELLLLSLSRSSETVVQLGPGTAEVA